MFFFQTPFCFFATGPHYIALIGLKLFCRREAGPPAHRNPASLSSVLRLKHPVLFYYFKEKFFGTIYLYECYSPPPACEYHMNT